MKQIGKLFFLCFFMTLISYGQETLDCDVNLRKAFRYISYLKGSNNVKADSLKAIEYLKPCVDAENAMAQLFMAKLYVNSNEEKNFKKGFRLTKKAAKQDLPIAAYELGILYKYGKGVDQNLNKAAKWFRKGYNLGNSKAAYSLGYMFLKGFGGEKQDYKKAVKWFRKSDYPMAKHWLAVCYYFGYGVQQNKAKAIQTLKENETEKSDILLYSLAQVGKVEQLTEQEVFIINQLQIDQSSNSNNSVNANNLIGTWNGSLLQFDWAKKSVMQRIPVTLVLKKDSISDQIISETIINNNQNTAELLVYPNEIRLEDLSLNIKHPYPSIEEGIQNHKVVPSNIKVINIDNDRYILFDTENFINNWKEPGAPMVFILKKDQRRTANNVVVTDDELEALNAQTDFIKVYPNPFENDLIIAYDLGQTSDVAIKITSIDGLHSFDVATINQQIPGSYLYHFEGSILQDGMYVITITYNTNSATKMILKN